MSKKVTTAANGGNYWERLKAYFGHHIEGLDVTTYAGEVQAQVVYCDFKHIDTVRRELHQMMPEVNFTKLKRNFTSPAIMWALSEMIEDEINHPCPKLYCENDEGHLVPIDLMDLAMQELRTLELDQEDNIHYTDLELKMFDDGDLISNAQYQ